MKWFGSKRDYREFVKRGIAQGQRPQLVGGGLIRSQGGWSAVKAMRRSGEEENGDERIFGSGEFVEQLLAEAEAKIKRQLPSREMERRARMDPGITDEEVLRQANQGSAMAILITADKDFGELVYRLLVKGKR